MFIRWVTLDDVPALVRLEQLARAPDISETTLRTRLAGSGVNLLAILHGSVVGVAYSTPALSGALFKEGQGTLPAISLPDCAVHVDVVSDSSAEGVDVSIWSALLLWFRQKGAATSLIALSSQDRSIEDKLSFDSARHWESPGHASRGAAVIHAAPESYSHMTHRLLHYVLQSPAHSTVARQAHSTPTQAEGDTTERPRSGADMAETAALVLSAIESLGLPQVEGTVDMRSGFMELGLDSDDVVALVAQLNKRLPFQLSETAIFEQPSPAELTGQCAACGGWGVQVKCKCQLPLVRTRAKGWAN